MYRTYVILRHTFFETIVQPIFSLLLVIGAGILVVYGMLPFFTFGEDTVMYMAVGLDVILLLALIISLFAASKSVFEEIEDRTMLTLMSKPVQRWEVLLGKYLGIASAALLAIVLLGIVFSVATYARIPVDYQIRASKLDDASLQRLYDTRLMHLMGLLPSLVAVWLQVSVLSAISVALSTRFPLVVNLPVVILIYIAGNLTQFMYPIESQSQLVKACVYLLSSVLPYLSVFDIKSIAVHSSIAVPGTRFVDVQGAQSLAGIWGVVGLATVFAIAYSTFALAGGLWLFRYRELGGNEG